jgi:DnaK suppressor protein
MKKAKAPAKKAKPAAKAKKPSGGLLSKLKGAIARKPAAAKSAAPKTSAKPAVKKTAKPVAKAAPEKKNVTASKKPAAIQKAAAKPTAAKPAAAKVSAPKAAPVQAAKPVPAPPPKKAVAPAPPAVKQVRRPPPANGVITEDYVRSMVDADYMNDLQLDFFRSRLLQMRNEVLQRELDVKERLHEREVFADPADRATAEEEHWLDLRLRERESLLLKKIDDALRRIESKEYGYCEKTGDPIGIPRLLARPTATVCVDIKGQDERVEAQFRDR